MTDLDCLNGNKGRLTSWMWAENAPRGTKSFITAWESTLVQEMAEWEGSVELGVDSEQDPTEGPE